MLHGKVMAKYLSLSAVFCSLLLSLVACNKEPGPSKQAEKVFLVGFAKFHQGDYWDAIQCFNQAIELYPKYSNAHLFRGSSYAKLGNTDIAINDFSKAIELGSETLHEVYLLRGSAYAEAKEFQKALKDIDKAISISPNYAEAFAAKALVYIRLKKYDEARMNATKAYEIDAKDIHKEMLDLLDVLQGEDINSQKLPETITLSEKIVNDNSHVSKMIRQDLGNTDNIIVKSIDLNNDNIDEVIVTGSGQEWCGASGNCTFMVYKLINNGYKNILPEGNGGYYILKETTNGHHDLMSEGASSAFDTCLTIYKYDGSQYLQSKSLWKVKKNGKERVLTEQEYEKYSDETSKETMKEIGEITKNSAIHERLNIELNKSPSITIIK